MTLLTDLCRRLTRCRSACLSFVNTSCRALHTVIRCQSQMSAGNSVCQNAVRSRLVAEELPLYNAVIFDKDGTLLNFEKLWAPRAKSLAISISRATNLNISADVLKLLGVSQDATRVYRGLLAEGTVAQTVFAIVDFLVQRGVQRHIAMAVTYQCVRQWSVVPQQLSETSDLKKLFTTLHQHGIYVCICTSDNRCSTMNSLRSLDLLHLVDIIICGDDVGCVPKPAPYNAHKICKQLGIPPQTVAMVGDTPTDAAFAKNARLGMFIGVLSGVGTKEDLEGYWFDQSRVSHTTLPLFHIVDSVGDILPYILPATKTPTGTDSLTYNLENALSRTGIHVPPCCKLIITDKDGTLTNVYPRWSRWARTIYSRLVSHTSEEIARAYMDMIGYSVDNQRYTGAGLVGNSILRIRDSLLGLLMLKKFGVEKSADIMEKVWYVPDHTTADIMPQMPETIGDLRSMGMTIAMSSHDTRRACDSFLACSKLCDQIDLTLSADEAGHSPKSPSQTMQEIVKKVGCDPLEVVVVGASQADLMSGRSAGVGLTIGVLSGFSTAQNLLPYADLLIPNISYLPKLLRHLPRQHS